MPSETPTDLRSEIQAAINRNSSENGSNTPDFILADYLLRCLDAFDAATIVRDAWYKGKQARDE